MNFNRFTNYFFRRKSSRRDLAFDDVIDYPDATSISSSTPSLRISSAPSVRASMRTRLDRSVTPPPLLHGPSSPVYLEARSTPTNYSPPVTAELSRPIRIEANKSSPTEMALSCPKVVAIGTPPTYSPSSPSPRPTSGLISARPINGSVPGPIPGAARVHTCGTISESTNNRGSTLGPTLGSINSPTFGSVCDSIHVPALGTTYSPAFRSTNAPTHGSISLLAVNPTHGPAFGSTHGSTHCSVVGSTHVATRVSTHDPAFDSTRGSIHGPAPLSSSASPARDRTPMNDGPCEAGPPCSSSTPLTQSPSTSPSPPTPPPPLEGRPSCSCSREVELLRNESRLLRTELTKSRQTITQMKEREKLLRHRLSEQARRQIERGGSAKFEDISLGDNRPSQLIRRYGNLYSDGRLDAMDALDELREVAEFNDLKEKLLLSVIVLSFRSARKNLEEMKSQVRHLLRISNHSPPPPTPPDHPHHATSSGSRDLAVTPRSRPLPSTHPAVVELEDIISVYLRKTLDHQNLTRNYQEVRERVWATLFDFPKLRFCRGLQHYIEECVRLAWALTLQNPPYIVDYKAKFFSPDEHTRFHTSDPDSIKIRAVLWPALREGGDTGPCVYKGVVVT